MDVLYFTVFTGIESIPPCMSNLGVTIQIGFRYTKQHEWKGEFNKEFFPEVQKSALHGDAVSVRTQSLSESKSAVTGCLSPLLPARGDDLNF